ncbi:hypothetical protein JXB31_02545 [Candidatus Woesearchaeota archaeon]|nr:hypothetical protein [Candidatus Woesearchaeota archaeon]
MKEKAAKDGRKKAGKPEDASTAASSTKGVASRFAHARLTVRYAVAIFLLVVGVILKDLGAETLPYAIVTVAMLMFVLSSLRSFAEGGLSGDEKTLLAECKAHRISMLMLFICTFVFFAVQIFRPNNYDMFMVFSLLVGIIVLSYISTFYLLLRRYERYWTK